MAQALVPPKQSRFLLADNRTCHQLQTATLSSKFSTGKEHKSMECQDENSSDLGELVRFNHLFLQFPGLAAHRLKEKQLYSVACSRIGSNDEAFFDLLSADC